MEEYDDRLTEAQNKQMAAGSKWTKRLIEAYRKDEEAMIIRYFEAKLKEEEDAKKTTNMDQRSH